MADNDVQIRVGGDVKDLQKAAADSVRAVNTIGAATEKVQHDVDKVAKARAAAAESVRRATGRSVDEIKQNLEATRQRLQASATQAEQASGVFGGLGNAFNNFATKAGLSSGAARALGAAIKGSLGAAALAVVFTAVDLLGAKLVEAFTKAEEAAKQAREALKSATDQLLRIDKSGGREFTFGTRQELIDAIGRASTQLSILQGQARDADAELTRLAGNVAPGQVKSIENAQRLVAITEERVGGQQDTVDKLKDELIEWDAIEKQAFNLNSLGATRTEQLKEQAEAIKEQVAAVKEVFKFGPTGDVPGPLTVGPGKPETRLPRDIRFLGRDQEREDPFDTLQLGIQNTDKALQAGIIDRMTALQQQTNLLKQQALLLLSEGVSPLSEQMLFLKSQIDANTSAMAILGGQFTFGQQAAIDFGQVAGEALADIILGFENLKSLGDTIKGVFRGIAREIAAAAAKAAILNFLFPGAGSAAGGFGGLFKSFIGLASGGIVTRPTPALIGEKGPEAVIPLSKLGSAFTVQVVSSFQRIPGGDFLLGIQEAQNTRGVGGVKLS